MSLGNVGERRGFEEARTRESESPTPQQAKLLDGEQLGEAQRLGFPAATRSNATVRAERTRWRCGDAGTQVRANVKLAGLESSAVPGQVEPCFSGKVGQCQNASARTRGADLST